jgi:hypothetical protein
MGQQNTNEFINKFNAKKAYIDPREARDGLAILQSIIG